MVKERELERKVVRRSRDDLEADKRGPRGAETVQSPLGFDADQCTHHRRRANEEIDRGPGRISVMSTIIIEHFRRAWPLVSLALGLVATMASMILLGYGLSELRVLPF